MFHGASAATYVLVGLQVGGLLSAALARFSEGSLHQVICQRAFFACLAVVGIATLASPALGTGTFMASGATLGMMVLFATWDLGKAPAVTGL